MPYWTAGHAAGLVALVLTMFGLAGLVARYGGRLGALGLTGIIVAVPGIVLTACAAYGEAFVLPPLARIDQSETGPALSSGGPARPGPAVPPTSPQLPLVRYAIQCRCHHGTFPAELPLDVSGRKHR